MSKLDYIGNELELFSFAENWKNYWSDQIVKYLGSNILEVGAGLGGTTKLLLPKVANLTSWVALEPDSKLADQILPNIGEDDKNKSKVSVEVDTLEKYGEAGNFDSMLYIDVIEHIEDDRKELKMAVDNLKQGGHLIIVVPAHNFLFSPFDKAIGHFRRYNRKMLTDIVPEGAEIVVHRYLDSLGLFLSLGNKMFLKQSYPTKKQILFWDNFIVPISKILDRILFFNAGKSVLLICEKK